MWQVSARVPWPRILEVIVALLVRLQQKTTEYCLILYMFALTSKVSGQAFRVYPL